MATSEARINANRLNSLKSRGPSSPEGKSRSRENSLKHGLTGAGIVVADRDSAEVERRKVAFQAELNPRSEVGKALVRQMAILSVRMDRSADRETAAIAERVRHAKEDFDRDRLDEADRLLDLLPENPRSFLRKLRNSPEGVEALIAAWQDLKADLLRDYRPLWTASHRERAENLTGSRIDAAGGSRIAALSRAIAGDFDLLGVEEGGQFSEERRQDWAREQMVGLIDSRIAELEGHYETLDFETIAMDRREAPQRALFDPSKEASLARRYESEARSGFFKAMKELQRVEKLAAERPAPAATCEFEEDCAPLASSRDEAPSPREPRPTPPRAPFAEPFQTSEVAESRRESIDRPPVRAV